MSPLLAIRRNNIFPIYRSLLRSIDAIKHGNDHFKLCHVFGESVSVGNLHLAKSVGVTNRHCVVLERADHGDDIRLKSTIIVSFRMQEPIKMVSLPGREDEFPEDRSGWKYKWDDGHRLAKAMESDSPLEEADCDVERQKAEWQ